MIFNDFYFDNSLYFRTPKSWYIYDSVIDDMTRVSSNLCVTLKKKGVNFTCSEQGIENEFYKLVELGYYKARNNHFVDHPLTKYVRIKQQRELKNLVLQVTKSCDLNCLYCPYSQCVSVERKHNSDFMRINTAIKSIDFFWENSVDSDDQSIIFYGGEPLLNFELINVCVKHSLRKYEGKKIRFQVITNGTLLNELMIDFFIKNNVELVFSIDGDNELNDRNRKFLNSTESVYDEVFKRIKMIYQKNPGYFNSNVSLSMVIDPSSSYDDVLDLFRKNKFLSKININCTILDDLLLGKKNTYLDSFNSKREYVCFLGLLEILRNYKFDIDTKLFKMDYSRVINALYSSKVSGSRKNNKIPTGQCIPGISKLFVTSDGMFMPCEKVVEKKSRNLIGDLQNGFDVSCSKKMLNKISYNFNNCCKCFAFHECKFCVAFLYNSQTIEEDFEKMCSNTKNKVCDLLIAKAIFNEIERGEYNVE